MARKLLQNNFSVQMIVELTELTEEEINEIKLELHKKVASKGNLFCNK